MTQSDKQVYKNSHGAHQNSKWKNTDVGDVTMPNKNPNSDKMSHENYDRMSQSPSTSE